jgi:ABC-type transporter Mla subunit MlaD
VAAARDDAAAAEARATEASQALIPLTVHRVQIAQRMDAVNAELAAARGRFDQAVVDTFVGSPGTMPGVDTFAAVLGAQSLDQLQDQIAFGDAVTRERESAMREVEALQRRLDRRGATLDALIQAAQAVRTRRDQALAEQQAALVREQQALDALAGTRADIVALIDKLRQRLAPQDISDVADAFQGDHHVSYGDWANAFLRVMGAPRCHENMVVTVAWQVQEGTQAAWNPLATTHRMNGSTDFNHAGVQNYRSLQQGLRATQETIEHGWQTYGYGAIMRSMHDCPNALETARAIAASKWCDGCANGQYVVGLVPAVEASFDTFAEL